MSNTSHEPVRLLVVSTMNYPDVAELPDTGTWVAMTAPGDGRAFAAGSDTPIMESVVLAMHAAEDGPAPD